MTQVTHKLLNQQDWATIIKKLIVYASYRIRKLNWMTRGDILVGGVGAEDLAHEAVKAVWSGERQWDPDRHPDLLRFLEGVVKSKASHLVELKEHVLRDLPSGDEDSETKKINSQANKAPPLNEVLIVREKVETIDEAIKDDDELVLVVENLKLGMKPKEVAEDLGLSVPDVYNLVRKLRRKVGHLFED